MLPKSVRQILSSPIPGIVDGYRYWRRHGARIRRARLYYQCAAGLTQRRVRGWENRSLRLFRRAATELRGLASGVSEGSAEWARTAQLMLRLARAPYRTVAVALARLVGTVAALALVVVLAGSAVSPSFRGRIFPRDLAEGRPWTASGSDEGMPENGIGPASDGNMFFHTKHSDRPWVEIDLGAEHTIRGILVMNRANCCQDRAIPLNFEVLDGSGWRLVAQRRMPFVTWKYDVEPVRARRVRFVHAGTGFLHLKRISIYGQ